MGNNKEFYIKDENGEFKLAGVEFSGFPSDGIWYVKDGTQSLIEYVGPINPYPSDIQINYAALSEDLFRELINNKECYNLRDYAKAACDFFAKRAGEKVLKQMYEF